MDYFKSFGIDVRKGQCHKQVVYGLALLFNHLHARISGYLQPSGLSVAQFNILMILHYGAGEPGMSQVDISRRLIVTPANMTRLLDKLEREGLVMRAAHPHDRRVKRIHLTPKAKILLGKIRPGYERCLAALTADLSQKHQQDLARLLHRWLDGFDL